MDILFDRIRPYRDDEIPDAMKRIVSSDYFPQISDFVFPDFDLEEARNAFLKCKTINEFQISVMHAFVTRVLFSSVRQFRYTGISTLDRSLSYLFISNHRDIVLDSTLLNYALYLENFRTTEITFGSNLMSSQLVIDIGKSNKMFKVERGSSVHEFIENSMLLSRYIGETIRSKHESVWIAQRNGRTKDGEDRTDQGLIKMLCMGGEGDLISYMDNLHIVPVSVSYQWEPCDVFKTKELVSRMKHGTYVKQEYEDLNSILSGIMLPKGNVCINVCQPLSINDYEDCFAKNRNIFFRNIANLIDRRIVSNYKLWNTNYVAHDIRSGKDTYGKYYTTSDKEIFLQRLNCFLSEIDIEDRSIARNIFLGIYANPVDMYGAIGSE